LLLELQHRSNNLLAVIQSIAHRTLTDHRTTREAKKILQARLEALARANQRLVGSSWSGLCLKEIARSELKLFSDRITVDGPDIGMGCQECTESCVSIP
jgi:two-component sensor histidine kinase